MKRIAGVAVAVVAAVGMTTAQAGGAGADETAARDRGAIAGARGTPEVQQALREVLGTQSQAEVHAMMSSGRPVEVLYDTESETFTAAVWVLDGSLHRVVLP